MMIIIFFGCLLSFSTLIGSELIASDADSAKLAEIALHAVRLNAEKLGAYSLVLTEKTTNRNEDFKRSKIERTLPNGAVFTFVPRNSLVERTEILASKDFFQRKFPKNEQQSENIWQFDSDLWNHFDVFNKVVVIRTADQLHSAPAMDLNAAPNFGETLDGFVGKSSINEAVRVDHARFGKGSIHLLLSTYGGSCRSELLFAENCRFLPVKYKETTPNGVVVFEREFEYVEVPSRNAFRVSKMRTVYDADVSVTDPQLRQGMQGEVLALVDDFKLLEDTDLNTSRMMWDHTWKVTDMRKWHPEKERSVNSRSYWLTLAPALVLVFVIGILVRAFFRRKS